jgi:hypothetical protein
MTDDSPEASLDGAHIRTTSVQEWDWSADKLYKRLVGHLFSDEERNKVDWWDDPAEWADEPAAECIDC